MGTVHVIKKKTKIYIYAGDHNPPHIHVIYGDYEAKIEIKTEKVSGKLPNRQLKEVLDWLAEPNVKFRLLGMFQKMNPDLRRG